MKSVDALNLGKNHTEISCFGSPPKQAANETRAEDEVRSCSTLHYYHIDTVLEKFV